MKINKKRVYIARQLKAHLGVVDSRARAEFLLQELADGRVDRDLIYELYDVFEGCPQIKAIQVLLAQI
jgi:hypothetical protein